MTNQKYYMNKEYGHLLTYKEMMREFAELYDGNDPTNCIDWIEYYIEV